MKRQHRHAPAEGRGTLSVRQPAGVSGEFTAEEAPHLHASSVFPREQPRPTWLTVGDAADLPAQHSSLFRGKPLKLSILIAAYNEESTITQADRKSTRLNS